MPHLTEPMAGGPEKICGRSPGRGGRRSASPRIVPLSGVLLALFLLLWAPSPSGAEPRISFADIAGGFLAPVRRALDKGANPDQTDQDGESLLEIAASKGKFRMVRLLLHYGANPDLPDISGKTPLYRAAQNGHAEIVRLLLARGADPNRTDGEGTAMDWAIANRHRAIVTLLENWTRIRRHYLLHRLPRYLNLVSPSQRVRLVRGSLLTGRLPYALPHGILTAPWKSRSSFVEEATRADTAARRGRFGKSGAEPLWRRRAILEIGRNLKGYRPPF